MAKDMADNIDVDDLFKRDHSVKVLVTADTNRNYAKGTGAAEWSCRIRDHNRSGLLLDVFSPVPDGRGTAPWMVFLPWSSISGVTPEQ